MDTPDGNHNRRAPSLPLEGAIGLITGIMAAGKSTIAQQLAERLPASVHLRGDLFRKMIVNGRSQVSPENWEAAAQQLHLRYRLAVGVAREYAAAGFAVIYQDVVLGTDLDLVIGMLGPDRQPVYTVVLAPSSDVAAQRDHDRAKTGYLDWTPEELDASLRTETPRIGVWVDTSELSVDETVDTILARLNEALIQYS